MVSEKAKEGARTIYSTGWLGGRPLGVSTEQIASLDSHLHLEVIKFLSAGDLSEKA